MDKSSGSGGSETIKVGNVDITINVRHHDGGETGQPGGSINTQPRPDRIYSPPVRKRRSIKNIISIIVICYCVLSIPVMFHNYSYITPSTQYRRAIASGAVNERNYYTDDIGWIDDKKTLDKGMDEFYKATGVLPYVYITNTINGSGSPTEKQLKEYATSLYSRLFTDEAHLLVVFLPSGNSLMESVAYGTQAAKVIDAEAENILRDFLNYYYSDNSYTNSKSLSESFSRAADRIMGITLSPWVVTLICVTTTTIVAFFYIRRRKKERETKEDLTAREVEDLLSIPLEKFGDPEVEELAKKYEDKN